MRLVYLSLAWVAGIFVGTRFDIIPWYIIVIPLAVSLLFAIFFHRQRALLLGGLCLALLLGGILRFQSLPTGDELQQYRGGFELRGAVAADPDVRDHITILRLEVREIKLDGEWHPVSGRAWVNAPRFPALGERRDFPFYRYGDLLEMKGYLESPRPSGFGNFLRRQRIYAIISRPRNITLVACGKGSHAMELIYGLRSRMSQSLKEALPRPHCSLAQAMLLGRRGFVCPEIWETFRRTGTAHLLAISGLHVSIVAGIALSAAAWVLGKQRPTYLIVALSVIWLYALMSGMRPPVIRAATMGSLWLFADWLGRPRSGFTALTFAAAIMLAFNPLLLGDVGFQLSFAAVAGLVLLTPIFQSWGRKVFGNQEGELSPTAGFLIGSAAVSLGAILGVYPLLAYYFDIIPLVGLPASLLTVPAIPGIILTSALVGIVGIFAPVVAGILGSVSWLFITYVLKVVELFAAIPFVALEDVEIGAPVVAAYYGILLVAALWLPKNWKRLTGGIFKMRDRLGSMPEIAKNLPLRWIIPPLAVAAILIWIAALTTPDDRLRVFVLDVGEGDSILIQRGNHQILVDGGPSDRVLYHLGDKLPFWDRTLELLVLTHPDADHVTGLVEVLRRFRVEKVLTSRRGDDSDIYREWSRLIEERGVKHITAQMGQQITMGDAVQLTVLHPSPAFLEGAGLNNASIVLRLTYGNFSLLLPGDIGREAKENLLAKGIKLRSTVLTVAHQGKYAPTTPQFLSAVNPTFVTISVGADTPPHIQVIERLLEAVGKERLHLTSANGTIAFITDGEVLLVRTER